MGGRQRPQGLDGRGGVETRRLGLIFLKYISDAFEEHYACYSGNHGGMKYAHSWLPIANVASP